jgi:hypothetical protein
MRARLVIYAAAFVASASTLQAQANTCPAGTRPVDPQDACQMAVDVFQFMAPQLGVALTGGNATLGRGGALGGLGHFSVGLRGNVVAGEIPDFNKFPVPSGNGAQTRTGSNALPSKTQILGLPTVDAAIGIFKGLPLAVTNVGGVDLLLSATYIPTIGGSGDDFQLKPKSNLKFGYGARLGLVQESIITPGVSLTYLKRDIPTTDITGTSNDVTVDITDAQIKTSAWRIVASKNLLLFGLALGAGQDKYDQSARVAGTSSVAVGSASVEVAQKLTRTNVFGDISMNMPLFKIVGEIGQVSGGKLSADPMNEFTGGSPTQSRIYGSVGVRLSF